MPVVSGLSQKYPLAYRPSSNRTYDTRAFEVSSRMPLVLSRANAAKNAPGCDGSTFRISIGAAHDWYIQASCSIGAFFAAFARDKTRDRKSTRLNSSHRCISYAVFCLKKK